MSERAHRLLESGFDFASVRGSERFEEGRVQLPGKLGVLGFVFGDLGEECAVLGGLCVCSQHMHLESRVRFEDAALARVLDGDVSE